MRMAANKDSVPSSIRKLMRKAEKAGYGRITFGVCATLSMLRDPRVASMSLLRLATDDWYDLTQSNRSILAGAFGMQERIRGKVFGMCSPSFFTLLHLCMLATTIVLPFRRGLLERRNHVPRQGIQGH